MRKIGRAAAVAGIVGVVLVAGTATYAATSHSAHPGPAGPLLKNNQVTHQISLAQEKLKNSVVVNGFSGGPLNAGQFTNIDAGEKLVCPVAGSSTCSIEADMSVQAQGTGTGNAWAICLVVDGNYATCPYYGFLDSAFFENGTQVESLTGLAVGRHTVQTQVFSANGGTVYNYSLTYHAYKP